MTDEGHDYMLFDPDELDLAYDVRLWHAVVATLSMAAAYVFLPLILSILFMALAWDLLELSIRVVRRVYRGF
jgi:hypothetical protein